MMVFVRQLKRSSIIEMRVTLHQSIELINVSLLDDANAIDGKVAVGAEVIVAFVNEGFAGAAIFHRNEITWGDIERLCLTTAETKTHSTKERHALAIATAGNERMHAYLAHDERLIAILRVLCGDFQHVTHER